MILEPFEREPGSRNSPRQREGGLADALADSAQNLENQSREEKGRAAQKAAEASAWARLLEATSKLPGWFKASSVVPAAGMIVAAKQSQEAAENAAGLAEVAKATREIESHFRDRPEKTRREIARESAAADRMQRDKDRGIEYA